MAIPSIPRLAVLTLGLALAAAASAADEAQLVEAINAYRGQVQSCGGQASGELPPLAADPRLALPVNAAGDLQQAMAQAAYPMVNVQSISLSGPRDAGAAMKALQESFCRVVLDPQFVDVGVSRQDRDWRIVLARPLLRGGMGDWQAEGQKLLERINAARGQARQCGGKPYAAAQPLAWNATLGGAAEAHSRAMANGNFFDHLDRDGRTPRRPRRAGRLQRRAGRRKHRRRPGRGGQGGRRLAGQPGPLRQPDEPRLPRAGRGLRHRSEERRGNLLDGHVRFVLKSSAPGADDGLGAFRKRKTRRHGAGFPFSLSRPQCGALRVRRMCRLTSLYSR